MAFDYTQLNVIQGVTFSPFISDYQNGYDRASVYYQNLQSQALANNLTGVVNYAGLANEVTTNSSVRGIFANNFSFMYVMGVI